ncbi:MAG: hypothetical protein ACREX9_02250 [Gammaproteobacteria bacterium]
MASNAPSALARAAATNKRLLSRSTPSDIDFTHLLHALEIDDRDPALLVAHVSHGLRAVRRYGHAEHKPQRDGQRFTAMVIVSATIPQAAIGCR